MTKKQSEIQKAYEWAIKNLAGKKVYHTDIGKHIEFTKKGIKHTLYDKSYTLKIAMIYHAITLLKKSRLYEIKKDRKERIDIQRVIKFSSVWKYKNERYIIQIIVRETKNKRYYYDHSVVKKINLE